MYDVEFGKRLTCLRELKNVSARDMSLSIGQNPGYINSIESGKSFPSMTGFFYICEFLNITPMEFFDINSSSPNHSKQIYNDLKQLNPTQLSHISEIIKDLADSNKKN